MNGFKSILDGFKSTLDSQKQEIDKNVRLGYTRLEKKIGKLEEFCRKEIFRVDEGLRSFDGMGGKLKGAELRLEGVLGKFEGWENSLGELGEKITNNLRQENLGMKKKFGV